MLLVLGNSKLDALRIVPTLSVPGKVSHFTATRLARCCQGEEALECPVTNARLLLHPLLRTIRNARVSASWPER